MRKLITLLTLFMLLLSVGLVAAQDDDQEGDNELALTVYNQGTALVQDTRTFSFDAGLNQIDFADVAAQINPTSVSFNSITDPDGTTVLEQNYVYDLVNSSALLERYLDEIIEVTVDDGTIFSGQLLSGRGGDIILRNDDGEVSVIGMDSVRDLRFPELPDGLITRPTLRWLVSSANAGEQRVELTYLTGGINWTADYNVLLSGEGASIDLNGWVTLNNTSGGRFENAQLKLIAGDVNRLPEDRMMREDMAVMEAMPQAAMAPDQVQQREFFEYQLYEVTRRVTLGENETKQVEFVSGADVPANTFYVYDSSPRFFGYNNPIADRGYGQRGVTDVQNYLEFNTGEDNGLGADLPAGRIRIYQEDVDGAALLIGENRIDHTPEGEDVSIYLGNAFDLVGERVQTSFENVAANVIRESFEISLRNRKDDESVVIRVPETLYRWSNWEILSSSHDFEQINAHTLEFRVEVPPQGETIISYTVQYNWQR